jgi:hypothetical protein
MRAIELPAAAQPLKRPGTWVVLNVTAGNPPPPIKLVKCISEWQTSQLSIRYWCNNPHAALKSLVLTEIRKEFLMLILQCSRCVNPETKSAHPSVVVIFIGCPSPDEVWLTASNINVLKQVLRRRLRRCHLLCLGDLFVDILSRLFVDIL